MTFDFLNFFDDFGHWSTTLASPILTRRNALEADDVQRIQVDGVAFLIGNYNGSLGQEDEIRVGYRIFISTRNDNSKRPEALF